MEDFKMGRRKQSNPKHLESKKKSDLSGKMTEIKSCSVEDLKVVEQKHPATQLPSASEICEKQDKISHRKSTALVALDYHQTGEDSVKSKNKLQSRKQTDNTPQNSDNKATVLPCDSGISDKEPSKSARKYQCDVCGRLLSTSTSLERHMLTHSGQRPFPCPMCPICFTTNGNLLRHLKSCHETTQDATGVHKNPSPLDVSSSASSSFGPLLGVTNQADSVNGSYSSLSPAGYLSLEEELGEDRTGSEFGDGLQDSDKYKPFLCTLCDKVFSTRTNCERHIRNRHSEKNYSRQELVRLIKFIPKNSADSHAICKYCKKDFVSSKMLKHHLRSPYSSCRRKPFACSLCQATFSTRNNCIRHITNLHPERKTDYKTLIVLNAPIPVDNDYSDIIDDDGSPPTMAILSPLSHPFSGRSSSSLVEEPLDDSEESYSDQTYSPENYHIYSPPEVNSGDLERNPLDLSMGPLDLSVKKSSDSVRSSPTSWFLKSKLQQLPRKPNGLIVKKKKPVKSLMERTVPMKSVSALGENNLNDNGGFVGTPLVNERPAKRPRPYVCQYCGIGFTIRGNMYRHFRHKHPEHVSKRRQKKVILSDDSCKKIDDILDSVVSGSFSPEPNPTSAEQSDTLEVKHESSSEAEEELNSRLEIDEAPEPDEQEDEDGGYDFGSERGISADGDGYSMADSEGKLKNNSYSMTPHNHACSECGRTFPWQSSLERHMYTHTGQKPFKCQWCNLKFSIKSNCERHCLRIHGKTFNNARKEKHCQEKQVECPICREPFVFKINCERHCLDVHQQHYNDIVDHQRRSTSGSHQPEPASPVPAKKKAKGKSNPNRAPFYYQCLSCNLSFESKKELDLHEENNHASDAEDNHSEASYTGNLVVDA